MRNLPRLVVSVYGLSVEIPMTQAVVVDEVELDDQPSAFLVRPATTEPSRPAVLWLHWLGHNRSNRGQFLPEAVRLAQHGVVSLLPQGVFPWLERPQGDTADLDAVTSQARRTRAAFDHLHAHPLVDPERIAVVGHDYGAMFALTLRDVPIEAMVVAAPDATWDHWFTTYWLGDIDLDRRYSDQFVVFDPLAGAAVHQDRLLFQWAEKDEYFEPVVRVLYAAAAPRAAVSVHEGYDHQLGDRAAEERFTFLEGALLAQRV
jgi:dienelactone hydrolase